MLMPKRVKHRKQFRGTMRGKANRGNKIAYGDYGIVAAEPCWIKSNQIEAARVAMTRYVKRGGQVWIKIFPDKPVTAQPAETRMGKGRRRFGRVGERGPASGNTQAAVQVPHRIQSRLRRR